MKLSRKIILALSLVLFNMLFVAKADLPVHCLKSQIHGKWKIKATDTKQLSKDELYKYTCKHALPSHESNAYLVRPDETFKNEYTAELNTDDSVKLVINGKTINAKWTMVYNEGFDIVGEGYSFFAFSKYGPDKLPDKSLFNKPTWKSMCYSTLVGFYHTSPSHWGCFYAEKVGFNPNEITNGDVKDKLHVVEGTVKKIANMKFKEQNVLFEENMNFLQAKEKETLVLHAKFKDHAKVVEKINKMGGLWEAKNYDEYSNLTIEELNALAGKKRHGHRALFKEKRRNRKLKSSSSSNSVFDLMNFGAQDNGEKDSKYPEFPKNYADNMKYMNSAKNQGSCGSCFAVASLNMLEGRLGRFHNVKEKLSVQHVLSCSVYNQGCDGGYAYLSLKFGNELELVPDSCMPYTKRAGSCQQRCDINKLPQTYKVTDYYFLGGSYGRCTEYNLMKELYEKGPVVVSFEPDYTFMMYKKGVYQSPKKSWIDEGISTKPEWQKVDHSVTAVGWGYDEEKKVKYWILQNSWGEHWGENGYFKMLRGTDHLGIESICEAGNAIPIKKKI